MTRGLEGRCSVQLSYGRSHLAFPHPQKMVAIAPVCQTARARCERPPKRKPEWTQQGHIPAVLKHNGKAGFCQ